MKTYEPCWTQIIYDHNLLQAFALPLSQQFIVNKKTQLPHNRALHIKTGINLLCATFANLMTFVTIK